MQPFTKLTGVAAPLPMANVDTDKIIPAKWLKTIKRTGLGVALFESMRYREEGNEHPEFILNREPWRHAQILIAGENFGCGSSREHAPWALLDFGIRCVIAPSFADIFYNNCFKNGILPIVLRKDQVDLLMKEAENAPTPTFTVDLESCEIRRPQGNEPIPFNLDPGNRHKLLQGRTRSARRCAGQGDRRLRGEDAAAVPVAAGDGGVARVCAATREQRTARRSGPYEWQAVHRDPTPAQLFQNRVVLAYPGAVEIERAQPGEPGQRGEVRHRRAGEPERAQPGEPGQRGEVRHRRIVERQLVQELESP